MPLLPRFTVAPGQSRVLLYAHADGICTTEFKLSELRSMDDFLRLFPMDHPEFESFFALVKWARDRGLQPVNLTDTAVRSAYLTATFTPMSTSP